MDFWPSSSACSPGWLPAGNRASLWS